MKPTLAVCITSLGAQPEQVRNALDNAQALQRAFTVVIDDRIIANDIFDSRTIRDRIDSLNWAFDSADIVMAWNGGYNSVELLFEADKINIKPRRNQLFVGYSDNTILTNFLTARGLSRAAQGPGLSNWIATPEYDRLWTESLVAVIRSDYATMSRMYNTCGLEVLRPGAMEGVIIGGNNYTFDLLQGTPFCPKCTQPFIVLLEGEDIITNKKRIWQDFIRNLDAIMLQPSALENIRGLLIGKFPEGTLINRAEVLESIARRTYLNDIPIVFDLARGYSKQMLYLPIGEPMKIVASKNNSLTIEGSTTKNTHSGEGL